MPARVRSGAAGVRAEQGVPGVAGAHWGQQELDAGQAVLTWAPLLLRCG